MGDSMSTIINATTTNGVVIQPDNSGSLQLATNNGTTAVTINTSQNVGIGTTSPVGRLTIAGTGFIESAISQIRTGVGQWNTIVSAAGSLVFRAGDIAVASDYLNITSTGDVLVGTTTAIDIASSANTGIQLTQVGATSIYRSGGTVMYVGRQTSDGTLIDFRQAGVSEGSISVSGTTVSYNGGHLSRWSQLYNETSQAAVYRGTVLESVDTMCEWEKDGEPLPNEQATKTIVSTTVASKAVAGVFDMYDIDDEDNPYDFYVAQSGDFVIRIAQGVTVQNGDLLESAGDGTAKPQADDICRSSTIAKVTSNYVSATYEDGSYCVPCILMIG
jgi:hypothetical protein